MPSRRKTMAVIKEELNLYTEASQEIDTSRMGDLQTAIERVKEGGYIGISNSDMDSKNVLLLVVGPHLVQASVEVAKRHAITKLNGEPLEEFVEEAPYVLTVEEILRDDWKPVMRTVKVGKVLELLGKLSNQVADTKGVESYSFRLLEAAIHMIRQVGQ
jgi:hypothetical protein